MRGEPSFRFGSAGAGTEAQRPRRSELPGTLRVGAAAGLRRQKHPGIGVQDFGQLAGILSADGPLAVLHFGDVTSRDAREL